MAESADKRTSKAWQYFTDLQNNKAKCNFCAKTMSYKGGGPYNLIRHTRTQHPGVLDSNPQRNNMQENDTQPDVIVSTSENLIEENNTDPAVPSPVGTTTRNYSDIRITKTNMSANSKLSHYFKPLSAKKTELVNRCLVEIISKNYLSFHIVESESFRKFLKELNPNYSLPCRKTLSNALLPNYYNIEKQRIQKLLEEAEYVALTTDGWSSKPNENYMSLTVHFINKNTELQSCMLECHQYSDRHTAENLKNELIRMCDDWNITQKVVAVTSDNASNIKAAIKLLKWKQIPCFAHTLNLVVQSALNEIKSTQSKIKAIVQHFKRSPLATQRLKEMQKQLGEKELKLKQDVTTRWNSTFIMFQSVINTKRSLMSLIATEYQDIDNINAEDLDIIATASELLSFFKDVTEEMSSERKVTASQIILISNALKKQCSEFLLNASLPQPVNNMARVLLEELTTRFLDIEDNSIFAESTLVDPRFKRYGFENEFSYNRACSSLKRLVANVNLRPDQNQAEYDAEVEVGETLLLQKKRSIWDDFDKEVSEIMRNANPTAAGIIEVDKYLQEPLLHRLKDPFKWWEGKKSAYPRLYEVAKKRLCISATSVPSERIFSKSGQVITERRNRLSGKKVAMLLFLNYNM